jgi:hypothetical protein
MNKELLLWCSPGFGMIEMWLPVVKRLKENGGATVNFVFPEPSSLRLVSNDSDLFHLAEIFSDKVVYRGYSGRWFVENTLVEAKKNIKFSRIDERISKLANRLSNGKLSKYYVLKKVGIYISTMHKYLIKVKEDIGGLQSYNIDLFNNMRGILCDITAEGKSVNEELKNKLISIPKFSINHGVGATWHMDRFNCKKRVKTRRDTVVYNMSHFEDDGYKKCHGILDKNLVHVGIPSYDKDWVKFIFKQQKPPKEDVFDSFVLIIGRPASPFNTLERKKSALRNIYNTICIKHKLKIVVKPHPKESINGTDGHIYRDTLGIENYGKTWMYSDQHPFILGNKTIFSISFYSGVALGMLSINKPTIEYLDLRGIDAYDNNFSLRDKNGTPVFSDRYANLVLGASTSMEFDQHVDSILNRYEGTVLPLYINYKNYFNPLNNASEIVANDICIRLKKDFKS